MNRYIYTLCLGLALVLSGCIHRPDVVLRTGSQFTKASSLSLTVSGGPSDKAIFKPELEKELLRRGFNIITDDVSQVVLEERRAGGQDVITASKVDDSPAVGASQSQTNDVTQTQKSKLVKADYSGRIDYLYNREKHEVRRVNFTIFEVETGSIVASIGYEKKGDNFEIAKAIADHLDAAVTGVPVKGFFGGTGAP